MGADDSIVFFKLEVALEGQIHYQIPLPGQRIAPRGHMRYGQEVLAGAIKVSFIPMQDGVDFGCHADFGQGEVLFYLADDAIRKVDQAYA